MSRNMTHGVGLAAVAAALMLGGCGVSLWQSDSNASSPPPSGAAGASQSGPVSLTPGRATDSQQQDGIAEQSDTATLKKAIERYRAARRRAEAPYETAAVDLDGDGRPESLVLFSGSDWCSPAGCSLVVFCREGFGYRAVSHTINVKAPLLLAAGGTGWRNLIVSTGDGTSPARTVRLVHGPSGYPANALRQPAADRQSVAEATPVLSEQAAQPAEGGETASAR